MIPGALPPSLDGGDPPTTAPAPGDDPEAAAAFAALVAQLLGPVTIEAPPAPQTTGDADADLTATAPPTSAAASIGVVAAHAAPIAPTAIELPQPAGEPSTRFAHSRPEDVPVEPAAPGAVAAAPMEDVPAVGEPSNLLDDLRSLGATAPEGEPTTPDQADEPTPAPTDEVATTSPPDDALVAEQAARPARERHVPQGPPTGWTVAPHEDGPARPAVSSRPDDAPTALDAPPAPATPTVRNDVSVVTTPVERPVAVEAPAAPSAAHASTPTGELPVVEQVAARVTALDLREDGRHELSVDLHPAELGGVGVDVVVDSGRVHVTVRADEPAATALLRDALDDLRRELAAGGLDVGDLAAHDRRRSEDRRGDGRRDGTADGGRGPELTLTFPVCTTTTSDRGVDVLL